MNVSFFLQYSIVAIAVLLSLWVVMKKQFPHALRRARVGVALPLLREGRPPWLHGVGRWIAPPSMAASAGTCGGCDNCGPQN
jgi:hypothetical protein